MSEGVVLTLATGLHVAVDFWRRPAVPVAAHFLTHMHADHTAGLSDAWRGGAAGAAIHCSPATAVMLREKWPGLSAPVVPLTTGETHVLRLPLRGSSSGGAALDVGVTPLDACHCLGAVMFLFEGPFGRILHTGDFRWELVTQASLEWHPLLTYAPIDLLLLDNTYCHPRFEAPTRAEAEAEVLRLVHAHPRHDIVLGVDSLGKEELLVAVAAELAPAERLGVPALRMLPLQLAGHSDALFTADLAAARVRVMPRWQLTVDRLARLNRSALTLGIMCSGFDAVRPRPASEPEAEPAPNAKAAARTVGSGRSSGGGSGGSSSATSESKGGGTAPRRRFDLARYKALLAASRVPDPADSSPPTPEEAADARALLHQVPYSLHSSFAELRGFVGRLRPRVIRGITKGSGAAARRRETFQMGSSKATVLLGGSGGTIKPRAGAAAGQLRADGVPFSCLDPAVHFSDLLDRSNGGSGSGALACEATGGAAPLALPPRLGCWRGILQQAGGVRRQAAAAAAVPSGGRQRIPVPQSGHGGIATPAWSTSGSSGGGKGGCGGAAPAADSVGDVSNACGDVSACGGQAHCAAATAGGSSAAADAAAAEISGSTQQGRPIGGEPPPKRRLPPRFMRPPRLDAALLAAGQ